MRTTSWPPGPPEVVFRPQELRETVFALLDEQIDLWLAKKADVVARIETNPEWFARWLYKYAGSSLVMPEPAGIIPFMREWAALPRLGISCGLTRDTDEESPEANACSTDPMDRLTDFVATVSTKDPQLGDWLQLALAAFFAGEPVPDLKRRRKVGPNRGR